MKKTSLLLPLFCIAMLAGCGGSSSETTVKPNSNANVDVADFTITLKSDLVKKKKFSDVSVTLTNGKNTYTEETDSAGKAKFEGIPDLDYTVTIENAPHGYTFKDVAVKSGTYTYTFTGTSGFVADEYACDAVDSDDNPIDVSYSVGDIVYDFEAKKIDGTKIKLSDALDSKKVVVLNFFYTTCTWCNKEFPDLQSAYEEYSDDIEIIALDNTDTLSTIKSYAESKGLTFPMCRDFQGVTNDFGITGFPTSIIIDKNGFICKSQSGAMSSEDDFVDFFTPYIVEDYSTPVFVY